MSLDPIHDRDLLDPRSRHNIHVTSRSDLRDIHEWSQDTLYQAVSAADTEDNIVVLDYGRTNIYLVGEEELEYQPPEILGVRTPPALRISSSRQFDPEGPKIVPNQSVVVSPEFDILVPAFDWDGLDEEDILPPTDRTPSSTSTGAGTGTLG